MRRFRFLHTADLHLGTPFQGLRKHLPEVWVQKLQAAASGVFDRIVDVALAEQVDFVTIAGDVFDADVVPMGVQFALRRGFERLRDAGVRVVMSHGNHDPLSKPGPIEWPDNVHVFPAAPSRKTADYRVPSVRFELAGGTVVQVSGFSYSRAEMRESFVDAFERDAGVDFAVALYHGDIGGAAGALHANYCAASVTELMSRGFDVWALGHIHRPMVLSASHPLIVYPGIPQGRHIREAGRLGCLVIDVDEQGSTTWTRHPVATVVWVTSTVSLDDVHDLGEVPMRVAQAIEADVAGLGGSGAVVRVVLEGTTPRFADVSDEDALLEAVQAQLDRMGGCAMVERVVNRTKPPIDLDTLRASSAFVGIFLQLSDRLRQDLPGARAVLSEWLGDVFHAGNELSLDQIDDAVVMEWVDQAEHLVLRFLTEAAEDEGR
ncbi:metallophosphoesterase [Alicyclobacillus cycloheptanicus]|uniref:DNA repair exonuclease SbcCD nuclease subunit n=1 Tax=Alicyclobacillus cycloheptanicus TaxID=1457 RepID=A0ABT9XEH1_9BACL|nr:metallophosphoesterase [Alicyclobacillus cycloheptanicus]MDQ0188693.1 DNA repair exonuclease SbcCD nuclease subunit [Alicyclobacillus cycloheptanicus]WDM00635.1 metallophosphoesterase [Alicyclobacillus cycloheptanicus]